eukprot:symbB.v1.2.034232.t1/scaffold4386.1/size40349/2
MDDDLEGLFQCVPCFKQQCLDETQLVELPSGSLALIAEDARKRMVKQQAFLWSVSTSNNPYYMCYRIREKNGLCNGYFWGCLNRWQPELRLRYGDGHEDVERSVRFFNCDGAVLRYCFLCVKTRCKTNSGGLQSLLSQEQRQEEEEKSTQRLVAEFPWLLREVKGSALGLRFRRGLRSKLMRENLLSSEGMNYLQSQKEMHLLEGAYWAVVKGTKGRKALQLITGTVELCSSKSCCLRLGNGKVYGLSSAEFYARLCSAEMHILWLPPAASKALGLPHRQLSCQLQQLLGLQPKMREVDASMEPSKGVKRKAADPPPKRGGFLQLLQRSANKEVLMSAWGCKFWMSRKVNRVA